MKKFVILFLLLVLPALAYFYLRKRTPHFDRLPVLGPSEVKSKFVDGMEVTDTLFHSIPEFSLINQYGDTVRVQNLDGNISVVQFFFASCPTICPGITANLAGVFATYNTLSDFQLISITVDPNRDSVAVLLNYSQNHNPFAVSGAEPSGGNWYFLTGNREEIYTLAIKGFFVSASEDVLAPGGFLHSEMLVLLDRERHIRGFFDGTDADEVNKLKNDIRSLYAEYALKERRTKNPEVKRN